MKLFASAFYVEQYLAGFSQINILELHMDMDRDGAGGVEGLIIELKYF